MANFEYYVKINFNVKIKQSEFLLDQNSLLISERFIFI